MRTPCCTATDNQVTGGGVVDGGRRIPRPPVAAAQGWTGWIGPRGGDCIYPDIRPAGIADNLRGLAGKNYVPLGQRAAVAHQLGERLGGQGPAEETPLHRVTVKLTH